MIGSNKNPLAIIMGDIVQSEISPSIERLHEQFNAAIDRQNTESARILASPLTITLGDEFQGFATSLAGAMRIARKIRYDLMRDSIDCRFAIGVAALKTPLNPERAWNMMGTGLAATRAKLNEKAATTYYRFHIPGYQVLETLLEAGGATLTAIERRWTPTQRHDIQAFLAGKTASEIAKLRNVSAHSIYKVRNSGDFDLYLLQWNAIQEALAELDGSLSLERQHA
jgi:hypothetical protein